VATTWLHGAMASAASLVLLGSLAGSAPTAADARTGPASGPGWGFTHTQQSADHGFPEAIASVRDGLNRQALVQNQHLMGWGAGNPEPRPGVYDFASLDSRIDFIRTSGGLPVITLCCAPDWMKGGSPGDTDWSRLEEAPRPEHYADFAALAGQVARRYPDVRHFLVWNEFKGFFDDSAGTWDAAAYTGLYNQVYDAIKGANPANQVGGPYLDMAAAPDGVDVDSGELAGAWGHVDPRTLRAFEYWVQHARGADFVVVDGHATTANGAPDPFTALDKFGAVSAWIRARTDLPLWWAEWYVEPPGSDWTLERRIAVRTAAMIEFAKAGVATSLYWNPPPDGDQGDASLWTSTESGPGGGRPGPMLGVVQEFARWFPPGTPLVDLPVGPSVRSLASAETVLLVNATDGPQQVEVDGRAVTLSGNEVRWVPRMSPQIG
jgi:hypothetical protein